MAENQMITPENGYIKQRYAALGTIRDQYADRAIEYAKVTLPYLMPELEAGLEAVEYQNDYNTEGAKLVNALANRYMETLFPAGRSFVKLTLSDEDYQIQEQQGKQKADIDSIFAQTERAHREKLVQLGARPALLDALKHAIVAGNSLIYLPKDGKLQVYGLDEFVMNRGLDGTYMEFITEDKKHFVSLDPELKANVAAALRIDANDEKENEREVALYTYVRRNPDNSQQWLVDQCVEDVNIGEQNTFTDEDLRWLHVGWTRTRREIYNRGLVEEHFGSFWTLSILTEALAMGCVTMADVKYLVSPGSIVDIATLNGSQSGSFHYGEATDVNEITSNKGRDIVFIKDVIEMYKTHLGEVFMYLPATMRNAERVTAEEIRMRASNLENAHGGIYSSLAESLQKPLARLIFKEMQLGGFEDQGVQMTITTGIDALSRGNENDKINHWVADLSNAQNLPQDILGRINWENFMKVTAAGRDVDFTKIVMSEGDYQNMQDAGAQKQAALDAQVRAAGNVPQGGVPGGTL